MAATVARHGATSQPATSQCTVHNSYSCHHLLPAALSVCGCVLADVFHARMQQLQQWLCARPERCIAVVSHWGVLQALTGEDFDNCELQTLKLSELAVSWTPAAAA